MLLHSADNSSILFYLPFKKPAINRGNEVKNSSVPFKVHNIYRTRSQISTTAGWSGLPHLDPIFPLLKLRYRTDRRTIGFLRVKIIGIEDDIAPVRIIILGIDYPYPRKRRS